MTSVGIRELKVHLSHYIGLVSHGEDILVTNRGKAVARIVSEPRKKASLNNGLAALAADGLITLPKGRAPQRSADRVKTKGGSVADLILEDRR